MDPHPVSRASIENFIAQRTLALAGASRSGRKFGNRLFRDLRSKGYTVHLLHHEADEIEGVPCVSSPAELPETVKGLVLVVKPEASEALVRQAHAAGIERVWMQQGAESTAAIDYCREHGIDVIHGECLFMYAPPVTGLHSFHHWLWGRFGKLPT